MTNLSSLGKEFHSLQDLIKKTLLKMFCTGSWYNEVVVAPAAMVHFGSKFHKSLNVDVVFAIQTCIHVWTVSLWSHASMWVVRGLSVTNALCMEQNDLECQVFNLSPSSALFRWQMWCLEIDQTKPHCHSQGVFLQGLNREASLNYCELSKCHKITFYFQKNIFKWCKLLTKQIKL